MPYIVEDTAYISDKSAVSITRMEPCWHWRQVPLKCQ